MIQLTEEQHQLLAQAGDGETILVIDPQTRQVYRLVQEEIYQKIRGLLYDATPWTNGEMAALAGRAFGQLDDDDYSHYLQETK